MNNKIKELEAKCWKDTSPEWAENYRFEFDIEKFAELIIEEGCKAMEKQDTFYGDYMGTVMKKHFGVQE